MLAAHTLDCFSPDTLIDSELHYPSHPFHIDTDGKSGNTPGLPYPLEGQKKKAM